MRQHKFKVVVGPRVSVAGRALGTTPVIVASADAGGYIALYEDEKRAERFAPKIRQAFHFTVERHGKLTIAWAQGQATDDAERMRACVV